MKVFLKERMLEVGEEHGEGVGQPHSGDTRWAGPLPVWLEGQGLEGRGGILDREALPRGQAFRSIWAFSEDDTYMHCLMLLLHYCHTPGWVPWLRHFLSYRGVGEEGDQEHKGINSDPLRWDLFLPPHSLPKDAFGFSMYNIFHAHETSLQVTSANTIRKHS